MRNTFVSKNPLIRKETILGFVNSLYTLHIHRVQPSFDFKDSAFAFAFAYVCFCLHEHWTHPFSFCWFTCTLDSPSLFFHLYNNTKKHGFQYVKLYKVTQNHLFKTQKLVKRHNEFSRMCWHRVLTCDTINMLGVGRHPIFLIANCKCQVANVGTALAIIKMPDASSRMPERFAKI